MSRIGKLPISLPKGVQVSVKDGNVVVKGAKGELHQAFDQMFKLENEDGTLTVVRPDDQKRNRALHGLYRSLIQNMITGVSEGYKLTLSLEGVGYRADVKGRIIELLMGYSHGVYFVLPPEIKAEYEAQKGASPKIHLTGIDKQLIGQVAAKIRAVRPPEPYKGKGIRLEGEYVRRKAGKSSGKGKK